MTENYKLENGVLTLFPGTEYLESEKFSENPDIVKAVLPEGLRHISVACFTSCENLTEVNIPSTVKTIDDGAFLSCTALRAIRLPEGLEEIADLAFQDTALEKIAVPASVRRIGEEAFFECPHLAEADVLGPETTICENAFGSDYALLRGFIAPGFPAEGGPGSELLYSLLWASCPERHSPETCRRAEAFIRANQGLVMERIMKFNNTAAMNGIAERRLLDADGIDAFVRQTAEEGLTELTALLIKAKGNALLSAEDFEL